MLSVLDDAYKVGMCNNTLLDGSVDPSVHGQLAEAERNKVSPYRGFWSVTLGGAEGLYIDDKLGNFEPGKAADFVALDWNGRAAGARPGTSRWWSTPRTAKRRAGGQRAVRRHDGGRPARGRRDLGRWASASTRRPDRSFISRDALLDRGPVQRLHCRKAIPEFQITTKLDAESTGNSVLGTSRNQHRATTSRGRAGANRIIHGMRRRIARCGRRHRLRSRERLKALVRQGAVRQSGEYVVIENDPGHVRA